MIGFKDNSVYYTFLSNIYKLENIIYSINFGQMDKFSDIKLELIGELIKESSHIRKLENELKIPKSTISDKLKELYSLNIVDFKINGRNKEFFIKNTIEAYNYTLIYEIYKLNKLIHIYPNLKLIIQKLKENTNGELIIIFGSYSKFSVLNNSDIDIYVNTNNKKIISELKMINSKINFKFGEFNSQSSLGKEIIKNHVIVQNFEDFYRIKGK